MALTDNDLKQIKGLMTDLATKDDLKRFATKDDLKHFATKADLQEAVSPLATKVDLLRTEGRLTDAMSLLQRDSFTWLKDHEHRIEKLERSKKPA